MLIVDTCKILSSSVRNVLIWVVHTCIHFLQALPVAWALMSWKTEGAYCAVLQAIADNLLPGFQPSTVMMDFDEALQNAVRRIVPGTEVAG